MKNDTNPKCPQCGAVQTAEDSQSLCPACLMLQAMSDESEAETVVMGQGQSLALNGPSEFPCDFGKYRLIRFLGRGGMGAVYEAEQRSTGRRVALKMLGHQLESEDMRQRFLREGRLAAGISHPNSLYVFGAEEIDGVPVITMEIADSGTLSDKLKKKGPLPIFEAVEATLGMIAGLESAHSAGVLHRDVKPSNIFVGPDGSVKVGDYGLSVSTVSSIDSFATATGVALGTPAYAAPEQLKGSELDVRADIYSVGATLFTLLTGRAPIEGKNPVQIVAAALDEKPESIKKHRSDAPLGLAKVVAKCLSKKPEQRYGDYVALRDALLPFSSEMPQPAPLSRRTVAGFVDALLAWFLPGVLVTAFYGRLNTVEMVGVGEYGPLIGMLIWQVLYIGVPEGIFGAGLGKWLLGLRVTRSGGQALGIGRCLIRSFINWFSSQGGIWVFLLIQVVGIEPPDSFFAAGMLYGGSQFVLLLAPFVTMRRNNGWSVAWDAMTDSRVTETLKSVDLPPVGEETSWEEPDSDAEWVGPYAVIERLSSDWFVGGDPTLRRRVWMRRSQSGMIDPRRCELARPGRARWQQRVEMPDASWDVFEAQSGVCVPKLLDQGTAPTWDAVRHWLYDLTLELAQSSQDGTLPKALGLRHVWITNRRRAVLLDEAWPDCSGRAETIDVSDMHGKLRFLDCVRQCCDPATIPLYARPMLESLATGSFEKLSFLAGNLRSCLKKRTRLDRSTRAASLCAMPFVLMAFALFTMVLAGPASIRAKSTAFRELNPDLPALNDVIRFRYTVPSDDRRFIHVHLAGHYDHERFKDYSDWEYFRLLAENEKKVLEQVITSGPNFTGPELLEADRRLATLMPGFLESERRGNLSRSLYLSFTFTCACLVWIAGLQLVTLMLFRGTLGQYLFAFAIVDQEGEPAGRFRLLYRWTLAWGLFGLAFVAKDSFGGLHLPVALAWMVGVMLSIMRPTHGAQDELSGCWLVAR
ncbi:protein kinase [bacterium]|nr:protein kinase [bacterium]